MQTRPLRLLAAVCLLLALAWPAAAEPDALRLQSPEAVGLGLPFQIHISSEVDFGAVRITWLQRTVELPLQADGDRFAASLLLGSDVKSQEPGKRTLRVQAEKFGISRELKRTIRLQKREFPVQRLSLPKRMVTLSQETLKRYAKEKKQVQSVLSSFTGERFWKCPFQRPAQGEVSSRYGLRRILNGKPRSPHRGLDLRTGAGAKVKACNHGRVQLTDNHYFSGRSVYIDHGRGMVSMYFHLSEIFVHPGQKVSRGEVIGRTGKTGRATGPHLHFGVSLLGQLVDPAFLLEQSCPY